MNNLLEFLASHSTTIMYTSLIVMLISLFLLMSLWWRLNHINRIIRWLIFNSLSAIYFISSVCMIIAPLISTTQHIHTHAAQDLFFVQCILIAAITRLDWIFVQNFWQWLPDPKQK